VCKGDPFRNRGEGENGQIAIQQRALVQVALLEPTMGNGYTWERCGFPLWSATDVASRTQQSVRGIETGARLSQHGTRSCLKGLLHLKKVELAFPVQGAYRARLLRRIASCHRLRTRCYDPYPHYNLYRPGPRRSCLGRTAGAEEVSR
jgi:hypothetical protein